MSRIAVASTLASYKMYPPLAGLFWLDNAERLVDAAGDGAHEVRFFAALEVDARGQEPFAPLLSRLSELAGEVWWLSLDTGADRLSTGERLAHICMGRNAISEWAMRAGVDWVMHVDSDTRLPDDVLPRLLELDWPICGAEIPTYCLRGEAVTHHPTKDTPYPWPVEHYLVQTAGALLVHRELFRRLRWRTDVERGLTDDPCYCSDARDLGFPVLVRRDVVGEHWPRSIPAVEYRGHDLAVRR